MKVSEIKSNAARMLTIRQLNVDLTQGFPRHWLGGDAFRTQLFNAQSFSFPIGEQYFIDSLRAALPLVSDPLLRAQVKGFIGQEAAHRHIHAQYNAQLNLQGHRYFLEPFVAWRIRSSEHIGVKRKVAVTMAYEHFTAIFADGILSDSQWVGDAVEPMKTLWTWHSVEETEHKSVAFDVYRAIGGGYVARIGWFIYVTAILSLDTTIQTMHCLYQDGSLFKAKTMLSALKFYFGRNGLIRFSLPHFLAYFRPGFMPWQRDNLDLAEQWSNDHSDAYRAIK
ncbi:MAG: metal-dependent hydrolase [Pseudomonadota bacterium]